MFTNSKPDTLKFFFWDIHFFTSTHNFLWVWACIWVLPFLEQLSTILIIYDMKSCREHHIINSVLFNNFDVVLLFSIYFILLSKHTKVEVSCNFAIVYALRFHLEINLKALTPFFVLFLTKKKKKQNKKSFTR